MQIRVEGTNGTRDWYLDSMVEYMKERTTKEPMIPIEFVIRYILAKKEKRCILRYDGGVFTLMLPNREVVRREPAISIKLFDMLKTGYDNADPEVVEEYKKLLFGAKAPNKFWSTMSIVEFNKILEYEALYLLDLRNWNDGKHLSTKDLGLSRIPAPVRTTMGFKLHDYTVVAGLQVKPWEMLHAPRGSMGDDYNLFKAIFTTAERYRLNVDDLKTSHLKAVCPSVLTKLGSTKKAKEFYKQYLNKIVESGISDK